MNAAGVLPAFTGVAVHDAWAPYDSYPQITHALCNSHVLRELIAITDHHAEHAADPDAWCWATQVIDDLLAIKTMVEDGAHPIDPDQLAHHRTLITHAAHKGANESPPGPVGRNTGHWPDGSNAGSPTTYDSRPTRTHRSTTMPPNGKFAWPNSGKKVSGGMRTLIGAQHFAALRSYLATTAKHGLDGLTMLTTGNPWQPQTT